MALGHSFLWVPRLLLRRKRPVRAHGSGWERRLSSVADGYPGHAGTLLSSVRREIRIRLFERDVDVRGTNYGSGRRPRYSSRERRQARDDQPDLARASAIGGRER